MIPAGTEPGATNIERDEDIVVRSSQSLKLSLVAERFLDERVRNCRTTEQQQ